MSIISLVIMGIGVFFLVVSVIGLWRFPDVFCRMHAVGKASTLGLLGVLSGVALYFLNQDVTIKALFAIIFQFLTVPVATHLLARISYLGGLPKSPDTKGDEISSELDEYKIQETRPE